MKRVVLVFLAMSGCGWSQDKYDQEWIDTACTQYINCQYGPLFGWSSIKECKKDYENSFSVVGSSDCQDYDGVAAKKCVQAYAALSCDDLFDPDKYPDACNEICSNTSGDTSSSSDTAQ